MVNVALDIFMVMLDYFKSMIGSAFVYCMTTFVLLFMQCAGVNALDNHICVVIQYYSE